MPFKFLLFDLAKGVSVNKYINKYRALTKKSRDEIISYQQDKLQQQIHHFYKYSKYFKYKLDIANIDPHKIKTLEDLKKIPVLTRTDLKNNFESLACVKVNGKKHISTSSGTTGIPVKYGADNAGYSAGVAAGFILYSMAGWKFSYRQMHIWGNPTSVVRWNKKISKLKSFVFNRRNIDSTLTNSNEGLNYVVSQIKKIKPDCIDGYTTAILNIALFIKKNNIDIPKPKIVIVTAENLLSQHKLIIEEVLGPVADLYGCGEINGVAIKPPDMSRYIIFNPHVIVETLEASSDGLREILVTDLDNTFLPMIRYKVGDLIDEIKPPQSDDIYSFDNFTRIEGRTVDLITLPNGKTLSPINLLAGTLFRKIGGIVKHKVLWDGKKLYFQFVIDDSFDHKKAYFEISDHLKDYGVEFEMVKVDDLFPDKNGKYKYFEKI